MRCRLADDELISRKRELHARIARSRRQIDRRLASTGDRAKELVSWRTYVVRHPALALVAALGGGMVASTLLRPARISGWVGRTLMSQALGGLQQHLWDDVTRIWTKPAEGSGVRAHESDTTTL